MLCMIFSTIAIGGIAAVGSNSNVSAGIAVDFPNYERWYIAPTVAWQNKIDKGLEFEIGSGFGINVTNEKPNFLLPVRAGLNLVFGDNKTVEPLFGLGLRAQFLFNADSAQFLMGPVIKGGVRVPIHPKADFCAELEQSLLIGPPKWLNTGTSIFMGVTFNTGSVVNANPAPSAQQVSKK